MEQQITHSRRNGTGLDLKGRKKVSPSSVGRRSVSVLAEMVRDYDGHDRRALHRRLGRAALCRIGARQTVRQTVSQTDSQRDYLFGLRPRVCQFDLRTKPNLRG
eukprot:Selendium_serpulae@DN492_c0_g1_i1.p1